MVYLILGAGFEEAEAIVPCDLLRRAGVEVRLAGIGGTDIPGSHGIPVHADCAAEAAELTKADMLILPGGLGVQRKAKYLYERQHAQEIPQVRELQLVCAYAFAAAEQNAANGTIVTAPTCGSCGVLPAVLMYLQGKYHYSDLRMAHALGVAGIIGNLIRRNASISGAECGCQAEIGSACSMAAAAMCELMEFPIEQIEYAAEIAMEHHLGLTCDPICGLVQIPCIERNAVAAKRAIDSANLAHMLVGTRTISFDMVVRTMYETGVSMNRAFRETSEGGLAKLYSRRAGQTLGK